MTHRMQCFALTMLVLSALTGCESAVEETDEAAGEPVEVLDLSARDTTVDPADNFFMYANGRWMENTEIPASKTGWGSFYIVRDNAMNRMHDILDSCVALENPDKGTPAQQIGDLYASFMDTAAIEQAGITPLKPELTEIEQVSNVDEMMNVVYDAYTEGDGMLFSMYIWPDDKDSEMQRVHFDQGGLGLPNRDYYFKSDPKSAETRDKYEKYISKIFVLTGSDQKSAGEKAADILALETKMAEASKSPVELRIPQENYHLLAVDEFAERAPSFGWEDAMARLHLDVDTVLVGQPKFFENLSSLLRSEPLETWKDYLVFHYISGAAPYLNSEFADARFDFYSNYLSGQKEPEERWKRGAQLVDNALGDALGRIYVEEYFPPSAKEDMLQLVTNLQNTYRERIRDLDWMSDSTKSRALEKLNSFTKKIGYPDEWKDYSEIEITPESLIANLQRIGEWNYNYEADKLGKPVDKTEWGMSAPTVNAYYNPSFNEIVFPAGILQPPFYYQNGDDAVNYGAIGAVIGHEMTHGFDDQGSQYDLHGNLENWWSSADRENFTELTQRVVDQYAGYSILDSVMINGELTQGENIADNGGLAIAYAAYQKTPEAQRNEKINGLTPDQRFFLAFAQVWRVKNTDERLRWRINNDPHSPEEFRVNGTLANMPSFYKAYDVDPDDALYRPDSVRTTVW